VTDPLDEARCLLLAAAFRMPSIQSMLGRKSSITNAFVSSVIPVIFPTLAEIEESLVLLGMDANDVRCSYCWDNFTEWDHLRPLVMKRRPTGYISEIANLVPACGKCNQSKGNKAWREWMKSTAPRSPTGRGMSGVDERIQRLEDYERWKTPVMVDFLAVVGHEAWEDYWDHCEAVVTELQRSQAVADSIRSTIVAHVKASNA